MSRIDDERIYSGDREAPSGARGEYPSYEAGDAGDDDGEGEERTTFLARPSNFSARLSGRVGRGERTMVEMSVPARRPAFDKEERTVIAPMPTPRPAFTRRAATSSAPPPPWSRRGEQPIHEVREETSIGFTLPKQAKRVDQIQEATAVAFPMPPRLPTRLSEPPPPPRSARPLTVERVDTMAPHAVDSTAALASETTPSTPTLMLAGRGGRPASFFVAASLGMVAAIFLMGIAIGSFAFGRGETTSAANGSIASIAGFGRSAPKPVTIITSPPPVAAAPETTAAAPAPLPPPAPVSPHAAAETPAPKRVAAAASSHPSTKEHSASSEHEHAQSRVAAASPAPKTKHAKPAAPSGASGDDMDEANAADALAKAQLEASFQ